MRPQWITCLLMLAASACGSTSKSTMDAAADAGLDGDADPAGVDLGLDLGSDPHAPQGFITLSSLRDPARTVANATFLPDGEAFDCATSVHGACTFYSCTPRPGANTTTPSAGTVQVTGGAQTLTFTPAADGSYAPTNLTSALFVGGETLTATGSGAAVPAFSASLTAPHTLTVAAPALPTGNWAVDRQTDTVFSWSGGDGEQVVITFGVSTQDPIEVECLFAAGTGSGTVAHQALALLPAGDGYFEVRSRMTSDTSAGAYRVRLRADADAVATGGAAYAGAATFQ